MAAQAAGGVMGEVAENIKQTAPAKLTTCMRAANIITAGLVVASGVAAFLMLGACSDSSKCAVTSMGILAFYTVLFGVLLLLFEIRVNSARAWMSQYCGFMYSNRGKAALLIFMSTLCFSVLDSSLGTLWWLTVLGGVVSGLNGIFVCATVCLHPDFDTYATASANQEFAEARLDGGSLPTGAAPRASPNHGGGYAFGDAHAADAASASYSSYDLQSEAPQPASASDGGAPFAPPPAQSSGAAPPPPPPPPSADNPFAADNPFSNV